MVLIFATVTATLLIIGLKICVTTQGLPILSIAKFTKLLAKLKSIAVPSLLNAQVIEIYNTS